METKFNKLNPKENFKNKNSLPQPNVDILAVDEDNNEYYVYLCNCGFEWRDSITGSGIMESFTKWKYVDESKN